MINDQTYMFCEMLSAKKRIKVTKKKIKVTGFCDWIS